MPIPILSAESFPALFDRLPQPTAVLRGEALVHSVLNPAYQALAPGRTFVHRGLEEAWPELAAALAPAARDAMRDGSPTRASARLASTALDFDCLPLAVDREGRPGVLLVGSIAQRAPAPVLSAAAPTLFEAHSTVMMLLDPKDGAIVDVNPAGAEFYGYERAAMRAMHVTDIDTLSREDVEEGVQAAAQGRRRTFILSHRLASGELRTVEIHASPVEVEGRRLVFGIIYDITEQTRMEQALGRERRRYQSIMAIAQDGIHLLDEHGTLIDANRAFLDALGYGSFDVGQRRVEDWDAAIPAESLPHTVKALIERPAVFRTKHRRKDGTVFDVEVSAGGIELEGRRYLLASARDITARIRAERLLAAKQAELEELNRSLADRVKAAIAELRAKDDLLIAQARQAAMGEMIGNIAHQWRQPLNALALILANLADEARADDLTREGVERAVESSERLLQKMSATINVFRDFFRPQKERVAFSARAQVEEAMGLVEASFRAAHIAIALDAPDDVRLLGVPNEWAQVVLNLLTNAKEAIVARRSAGGHVSVRLGVRDGLACLVVADDGGGVTDEVLAKMFEPYFSTKANGTGIGLYLSKQIVERSFGGRIGARNVEGGAELTVLAPLAP